MSELENKLNNIAIEKERKIIPENIKKGVSIFGVEGTLDSIASKYNAKSFDSLEELEQDSFDGEYPEGTLAIIAERGWVGIPTDTIVNTVKFPKTVTLTQSVTSEITGEYVCIGEEQWNFRISLTASSYIVNRMGEMMRYNSNDGITYIRETELVNDLYKFDLADGWKTRWSNNILDNFIQEEKTNLKGFRQWLPSSRIAIHNKVEIIDNSLVTHIDHSYADLDNLINYMKQNNIIITNSENAKRFLGLIEKAPNKFRIYPYETRYTINTSTGEQYFSNMYDTVTYYDIDLTTMTHTSTTHKSDSEYSVGGYIHENITHQKFNIIGCRGEENTVINEAAFWSILGGERGRQTEGMSVLGWITPNCQINTIPEDVANTKVFIGKSGNSEIGTKTFETNPEYTTALNTAKEIKGGNV